MENGNSAMTSSASKAGFAPDRLERIGEHLARSYVDNGKIAGCQVAVARRGQLAYFKSLGQMDRERAKPMRDDTIFRIASMTKPITSVALMMLYERGLFQLTDPVHRFVPEWRGLKVSEIDGVGGDHLVELERPPSVRDVLTHTSGLSYGFDPEDPVDKRYTESGLTADFRSQMTLEEMARRLGDLPLRFQPGARWRYSFATDVCAR